MEITSQRNGRYEISGHDPQVAKISVAGYRKWIGLMLSCLGFAIAIQDEKGKIFYINRKSAIKSLNRLGWNLGLKSKANEIIQIFHGTYPATQIKPTKTAQQPPPPLVTNPHPNLEKPAPVTVVEAPPAYLPVPDLEKPSPVPVVESKTALAPKIRKFVFVVKNISDAKMFDEMSSSIKSLGKEGVEFLDTTAALAKSEELIQNLAYGEIIVHIVSLFERRGVNDTFHREAKEFNKKFDKCLYLLIGPEDTISQIKSCITAPPFLKKEQILLYPTDYFPEMKKRKMSDEDIADCLAKLRAQGLLLLA